MGVQSALGAVSHAGGNAQPVVHADARDADDAVNVLDVSLDVAGDTVGVIRDLANCQGP